ncbi:class 1b ribonucleoside-diphosphate reductase subunit alpha [symbiont of Argiope bruennichi]|uniref:class 1b ribonucleoside-diphosphate reductase subunit alpha n=1 Tax=symbiont of Argiope bruennichi TaxID=2810479 RepID=UPI003DA58131
MIKETDFFRLNNYLSLFDPENPDFSLIENDKKALNLYLDYINSKYKTFASVKDKLNWMIENDYYDNFFENYFEDDILDLFDYGKHFDFKFASFLAAYRFYENYSLKTDDQSFYLEHFYERCVACALCLGQGKIHAVREFLTIFLNQTYQPATPTFMNAGRKRRGEFYSCYLLSMDDSLNSINYNISVSAQLSKIGGGVAIDLTRLRGQGSPIKGFLNQSSGVLPVAKLLEDTFSYANQLGQRPGAGAVYLSIFHWDILEFLDTKKINIDEKIRLKTLSIGVSIPLKFFELAKENKEIYVFDPYSLYKETNTYLDEICMEEMYDSLVTNENLRKKKLSLSARELLFKIARIQKESGYPYLFFKTNANNANPIDGHIRITNLCTEIMQKQEISVINNYGEISEFNLDVVCVLGSLNVLNVMNKKNIRDVVSNAIDALTAVIQISDLTNAPGAKKAAEKLRAVGLGAMNLAAFFATNEINYESDEALDFVNIFFMMVNYYSLVRSNELARIHRSTFLNFEKSDYKNGRYFEKYLSEVELTIKTKKVSKLFEGFHIPTRDEWNILKENVKNYGLYHAYRLAIAPTQSISYIQNATSSILPISEFVEYRKYNTMEAYFPMPFLNKETFKYYKSAYDMDQKNIIKLVSVMQKHIDQGISLTLFLNQDDSLEKLVSYYVFAQANKLKSLYYTRIKTKNLEKECESCSI